MAFPCSLTDMKVEVARCVAAEISVLRKELREELWREISHELRATDIAMRGELRDLCYNLEKGRSLSQPLRQDLNVPAIEVQPVLSQAARPKSAAPDRQRQYARRNFRKQFERPSSSSLDSDVSTTGFGSLSNKSQTSSGVSLELTAADTAAGQSAVQNADALRAQEATTIEECLRTLPNDSGLTLFPGAWDAPQPASNPSGCRSASARPVGCQGRPGSASTVSARGPNSHEARRQSRFEKDSLEERKLFDRYLGSLRSHVAGVSLADDVSFMEPDHPLRSSFR